MTRQESLAPALALIDPCPNPTKALNPDLGENILQRHALKLKSREEVVVAAYSVTA